MTPDILDIFFTSSYEHDVQEKILDDIDFDVPIESIRNFMLQLIDIPYVKFIDYINNHPVYRKITSRDITQCSSLLACTDEMCIVLEEDENRGKSFVEIGQSEIFKKYITSSQIGALRKYGENQVKTAQQFGLAFEYFGRWYLSCFGYVYPSLTEQQKKEFLSRSLLRNVLYADIIINVQYEDVHLGHYMSNISLSTLGRRSKNVVSLLNYCLTAMDDEYISRYNIYYPRYNNSSKKIVEHVILGTKPIYNNLPLYEDYSLGYVPLYSIKAACGYFDHDENPEQEGWLDISSCGVKCKTEDNFVVYAKGNSMAPTIKDGELCLFHWYRDENLDGKIVLTQCREIDADYEAQYTIKVYKSDSTSENNKIIRLEPINNVAYHTVQLIENNEVEYRIIGVFQEVLKFHNSREIIENSSLEIISPNQIDINKMTIQNSNHLSTLLYYQNKFNNLTCAQRNGKKAPHKIILLLSVISLIRQEIINKNEILLIKELISEFNSLWVKYVKEPSPFKANITKPYWHMQNESFWHLKFYEEISLKNISSIYSLSQLRDKTFVVLDSMLFDILLIEEYRNSLQQVLIQMIEK